MDYDWEDYNVGYAHPPSWTKFRKGESGNPKGRPLKKEKAPVPYMHSAADDALYTALNRKVHIKDADRTKQITVLEVVTKAQVREAAKGNTAAQRDILAEARRMEARRAEAAHAAAQVAETEATQRAADDAMTFKYVVNLKANRALEWGDAIQRGEKEPENPWPHPDDIMIDEANRTYWIRGPYDKESVLFYEHSRALRDAYFAQSILTLRTRSPARLMLTRFYTYTWMQFDLGLPKRWQIGELDNAMNTLITHLLTIPIRELRREWVDRDMQKADVLRPFVTSGEHDKSVYKSVNLTMRPLLKRYGYRSLAQFERAYADTKGNPPWPLKPT